jgi:hypothetical protein
MKPTFDLRLSVVSSGRSPATKQSLFESLMLGIWKLPFDLAQGGELVEPFVICYLELGILN